MTRSPPPTSSITMGCGDTCPYYPGKRYEDWKLDDPAGQPLEVVRTIRDEIDNRVRALLDQLHQLATNSRDRLQRRVRDHHRVDAPWSRPTRSRAAG